VNLFTGDFSYNIPLLDVGGYPINLFYDGNISMTDESSWVGLGWNLNPGVINRNVRGLPDDFSGEKIKKTYNTKPNFTIGGTVGGPGSQIELFGFPIPLQLSGGISYNNYTGIGLNFSAESKVAFEVSKSIKGALTTNLGISSNNGVSITPSASFEAMENKYRTTEGKGVSIGVAYNSIEGIKSAYVNASFNKSWRDGGDEWRVKTNGGFPISFAKETYIPVSGVPKTTISGSLSGSLGGEIQGTSVDGANISAYFNTQFLQTNTIGASSYGYLYSQEANNNDDVLHDFNREKDGPFELDHPNLPLTNYTYDVFQVSGEGVSGTFRPFRNDIGTVYDAKVESNGGGADLGVGVYAGPSIAKIGGNIKIMITKSYSGKWKSNNQSRELLSFRKNLANNLSYEPVYFKNVGEKNINNNLSVYSSLGGKDPVRIVLDGINADPTASSNITKGLSNSPTIPINTNNAAKSKRESRNLYFSYLNAGDAQNAALDRVVKVFYENQFSGQNYELMGRSQRTHFPGNTSISERHISEVTITKDDGTRYIYGLPAYNYFKKEVSFNISGKIDAQDAATTEFVSYTAKDNSPTNENGTNNFYSSVETPAYAYAYHLTAIISPDYVDLGGDGPTADDLGTYTKFNYSRDSLVRWRSPMKEDKAYFNPGNLYDENDDIAQYQFGAKEVYCLHSIETKNFVAEFSVSDRDDGFGIEENGKTDFSVPLKKLDKISLYVKKERAKQNPLKVVNFNYDYSLCKQTPNNKHNAGKLTLRKVYFTHLSSLKGKASPYEFDYKGLNPDFEDDVSDSWGTYKTANKEINGTLPRSIDNHQFPYTDQHNRLLADSVAAAWALTDIRMPTGGKLKVDYETDDYAYVQDRRSLQLFSIAGFKYQLKDPMSQNLYDGPANLWVVLNLTNPVKTLSNARELIKDVKEVFFQCKVNVTGSGNYEPIEGFATIGGRNILQLDSQSVTNGVFWRVILKLDAIESYNPITFATLQKIKKEFPGVAYRNLNVSDNPLENLADAISGLMASAADLFQLGLYNRLLNEGVAKTIRAQESFIRLNHPFKKKIGGGSRVKKITLSDNWNSMTRYSEPEAKYTINYQYTVKDSIGDVVTNVSSGVATYEPSVGGLENPFLLPERFTAKNRLYMLIDWPVEWKQEDRYVTLPYGESFYPGPSVGYSSVSITSNFHERIRKNGTGKIVHEYYTSKDFPTIVKRTPVDIKTFKIYTPLILVNLSFDKVTATQGYAIELNDMNGKFKKKSIFSESDTVKAISGIEHKYKLASDGSLNNTIRSVSKNGMVHQAQVGVEWDIINDERESLSTVANPGVDLNGDLILAGIVPLVIPIPYPRFDYEETKFRSIVTTKVIQRSGILDSIIVFDKGARTISTILLYDSTTGNEVLTATNNEYGDWVYSLTIPAHWVEEGMGPAFLNQGLLLNSSNFSVNNGLTIPNSSNLLFPGDEVLLKLNNNNVKKAWVLNMNGDQVNLIDEIGATIQSSGINSLQVIRSGRRNMQNISLGQVQTMQNPISGTQIVLNRDKAVINSLALDYSERWQTYAGFNITTMRYECNCSPNISSKDRLESLLKYLYPAGTTTLQRPTLAIQFNALTGVQGEGYFFSVERNVNYLVISFFKKDSTNICRITIQNTSGDSLPSKFDIKAIVPDSSDNCRSADNAFIILTRDGGVYKGWTTCFIMQNCTLRPVSPIIDCKVESGDVVNPFRLGLLGNFRPLKTARYITERSTQTVRNGGTYNNYDPYWRSVAFANSQPEKWTWTQTATKTDPFGKTVETKDTLGRYSVELYGFDFSLVTAAATNARYSQLASDGFEDYEYDNRVSNGGCSLPSHFRFDSLYENKISRNESHTGRSSVEVAPGTLIKAVRVLANPPLSTSNNGTEFHITDNHLLGVFNPTEGRYYLCAWVKITDNLLSYEDSTTIEVLINNQRIAIFKPAGPVIEGWQAVQGHFSISKDMFNSQSDKISVMVNNLCIKKTRALYFDDFRIQPFNSSMKSFVYDPLTLRHMATLDDNNMSTLYEYDGEGNLTRIKKETDKGVLTVQEVRTSKPKIRIE
jgi:hypothetical protein